jgi:putative transposase
MKRIPRPVLRALEALAQSPINASALAMAEGQAFAHDTLYRALNQPLASFFELSLELCKAMGGLDWGYLTLDDVLIQRYRSGKLGLKKARDTSTGAWVFGLSLVVLAWTDGKRRIPLAFLPYFGEESKLDLALALLEWAKEAGFRPEGCSLTPGTRRGRSWSGSMPTAGLLSRGSGLTVCWTVFSSGGMGVPVG